MTTIGVTYRLLELPKADCLVELDLDIEVRVDFSCGEPQVKIEAVMLDGIDLLTCKTNSLHAIGHEAKSHYESNRDFIERATERAGYYWRPKNADPSFGGTWHSNR